MFRGKHKTFRVSVDGYLLGYCRGEDEARARSGAVEKFGFDQRGFSFDEVDGQNMILRRIKVGCDTKQKLTDRTNLSDSEIKSLLHSLTRRGQIRCLDGCYAEV